LPCVAPRSRVLKDVKVVMISAECFWSDIVERDRGYRVQFADVRSLDKIIGGDRARPDRACEIYGVEGK
jgi:hypothetical protein